MGTAASNQTPGSVQDRFRTCAEWGMLPVACASRTEGLEVLTNTFQLRPFDKLFAATVAGWGGDDAELFWLAPRTIPPLTARKVVGWTKPTDRPLLLFRDNEQLPSGYGELNPLHGSMTNLWVGHVVVAPELRGSGLGRRFAGLLAREAFRDPRVERLIMVVFPDNTRALRCYQANGFRVTAEERHRFRAGGQVHKMLRLELGRDEFAQASVTAQ